MGKPKITMFKRMEIQMSFAVPLLRQLQDILGEDTITDALHEMNRRLAEKARAEYPADAPRSCSRVRRDFDIFAEGERLTLDYQEESDDKVVVHVSNCQYTEMMNRLDATDLGQLLMCDSDFANTASVGLDLRRTQTQMSGAKYCDFCFTPLKN